MIVLYHLAVVLSIVAMIGSAGLFTWAALGIVSKILEGVISRRDGIS